MQPVHTAPFALPDTAREGGTGARPGGETAAEAPQNIPGSLGSTFSPCGLPAVNLPLEILKECNYSPEEPKQRRLPSSGGCGDSPDRWHGEITAALLTQSGIFPGGPKLRPGMI